MLLFMIKNYTKKIFAAVMSQHKSLPDWQAGLRDALGQVGGSKNKRIAVAMSGGVDSSTTAWLLKKQGFAPMGFFMRFIDKPTAGEAAARQVCRKLGIKFYTIDLSKQFKKLIIDYFLTSYKKGQTPNPCIRCNQLIKFGELLKAVKKIGADYLATGHYARLVKEAKKQKSKKAKFIWQLLKANDKTKDQSYFLYTLTQKQLAQVLFPLGNYTKKQVRQIANRAKLPYLKQASQDICFLAGQEVNNFLRQNLKLTPGPIVLLPPLTKGVRGICVPLAKGGRGVKCQSEVLGKHAGLPLYTIGQRRGVAIGGSGPYYVAKMDYKKNILYVVNSCDNKLLYKDKLIAKNVNWLAGVAPKLPLKCDAVIRYRQPAVKCKITPSKISPLLRGRKRGGVVGGEVLVKFSQPLRAITAGQSVVFYSGEEVLGGGVIK